MCVPIVQCLYNHNQIKENELICYQCGKIFNIINDLMNHRKTSHQGTPCLRYQNKSCNFADEKCWFSHHTNKFTESNDQTKKFTESNVEMKSPNKNITPEKQKQGFWETPENLAPPVKTIAHQNMAMWNKMKTMLQDMTELISKFQQEN